MRACKHACMHPFVSYYVTMSHGISLVIVTLGLVPIIRCPRGNAADMVAEKLDKKLRENLRDARNSLFTGDSVQAGQVRSEKMVSTVGETLCWLSHLSANQ